MTKHDELAAFVNARLADEAKARRGSPAGRLAEGLRATLARYPEASGLLLRDMAEGWKEHPDFREEWVQ